MFKRFFKPASDKATKENESGLLPENPVETPVSEPEKQGWFSRLKAGLSKTRSGFANQLQSIFPMGRKIDEDMLEALESVLLAADLGVEVTEKVISSLTDSLKRHELKDIAAVKSKLMALLEDILTPVNQPLTLPKSDSPFVVLMVGVNGAGKTTTIGKLTHQIKAQGYSVMLAAGDTFRAAAVEQLQTWGERNQVPVISQQQGADSASVIFDALQAAKARGIDVLIADTAGRLQNKGHLMEELAKIARVLKKLDAKAPHEVMLVLDATTGQNAVSQLRLFHQAVPVSGLVLTKLDGTAKGGVIFALASQFATPIRFVGVGEKIEDLQAFDSRAFVEALFA